MNAGSIAEAYQSICAEVGSAVTVVAATKYVAPEQMAILAEAGIAVVGENRVQDMQRKYELHGDAFRWHFIGALQSNKARVVDSICELVHAVETDSAARRLTIPALLEVNLSGETSKSGVEESEIEGFLERHSGICGLMTMPPFSEDPEASRPTFRRLAELARQHGLAQLSMGTSQDWRVGVDEGATLIRVGSTLFRR